MRKGANKRIVGPGLERLHDDGGAPTTVYSCREKEEDDVGQDDSSHQRASLYTAGSTAIAIDISVRRREWIQGADFSLSLASLLG